jgi:hypothetical protein
MTSTLPDNIYIYGDGVAGYNDNGGNPSGIIAILRIREIVPLN